MPNEPIQLPAVVVTAPAPRTKPQEHGTGTGNTTGRVKGQPPVSAQPAAQANPPVKAETSGEQGWMDTVKSVGWEGLKFIPVVGAVPSAADAWAAYQAGDYWGAVVEVAGVIPVGKIAGAVGKLGRLAMRAKKAAKAAKVVEEVAKAGGKVLPRQIKLKCYKYNKSKGPADDAEFDRQLQRQENALNEMTAGEFRDATKNYNANRARGDAAAAQYRADLIERYRRRFGAAPDLSGKQAAHRLDVGMGGDPSVVSMGAGSANMSIGAVVGDRRKALLEEIKDLPDSTKLNVKLERCKK